MAEGVGAHRVATGHYARIAFDEPSARWQLLRAADPAKDQTYFLWGLTQDQLSRTLFPLGAMKKPDVRALARELDVPTAEKNDSQEICFVPNGDYAAFLDAYLKEQGETAPAVTGDVVSRDGRVLARHAGVHHFTIGQRKGLGVASGEPLYVISTDPATQRVTVGSNHDLLRASFHAKDVNWISIAPPAQTVRADVRIRNKHVPAAATLHPLGDTRVEVRFDEPQRAVTPGQAAVFYSGELVLGGGWIE
jgi:tRNA-specific 2-thiouridylase